MSDATPDAVKTAAAKADEMIRQLAAEANSEAVDGQAEDAVSITLQETTSAPAPDVTPAPTEHPAPAPAPDETAALRAEVAHLRNEYGVEHQRYLSLQGMFQKSQAQIDQLNKILADMQAAPAAAAYLSDDDETQFGSDLVDLATRAARQVLAENKVAGGDEVAALKAQIERLNAAVGGVQHESAEAKFEAFQRQVEATVNERTGGRFREIDGSEAFKTWLNAVPMRMELFKAAAMGNDLRGTLTFFDMYGTQAQLIRANQEQSKTTPAPVDPRLERQVAPGKSRSTPSQMSVPDGEKRQWTRSGIADFYKKKATYPASTANALEEDIFAAQNEGRVDYSK